MLTSSRTFSAAEEFTYDLQAQKRATVVGETTLGGGHFTEGFMLNPHLVAFVPIAKAMNPITKTSWDGVGVHPDVSVKAKQALDTAYVMALEKELEKTTEPRMKKEIDDALSDAKKRLQP